MDDYKLFNVIPSAGYSAGKYSSSLAQSVRYPHVKTELLVNWLLECLSNLFVAAVPFTLLNITSHVLNRTAGFIDVPPQAVYGDSCISFTFALSNSYEYTDPKIRFSNGPLRTWSEATESRVQFATITLTRNKAQQFGLKNHSPRVIDWLWLWIGTETKNAYRYKNKLPNSDIRLQHSLLYDIPTINLVDTWSRDAWAQNKNFWPTNLINTLDANQIYYALCYHDLSVANIDTKVLIIDFIQRGLLSFAQRISGVQGMNELEDLVVPNLVLAVMDNSRLEPQGMDSLLQGADEAASNFRPEAAEILAQQQTAAKVYSADRQLGLDLWDTYDI